MLLATLAAPGHSTLSESFKSVGLCCKGKWAACLDAV